MFDRQPQPGHPPHLTRSLGVAGVLFLTLSVTSPASSVFVIVPGMLETAGTGSVWAMLIAGLVCIATGFIYAELSSAWPFAGGEYVAVAHTLGPSAGFVMLGINAVNNLLFPPVIALGVSAILSGIVPNLPTVPLAIGIIAASTLVAILRIRTNAYLTGVFLIIELLALVVICWLGFASGVRPIHLFLLEPTIITANGLAPASWAGIGVATTIAIFALNGYGAAVYFGEEMHQAPRRIARAILWAVGLTLIFETVPLVAILVGASNLQGLLASADPFGLAIRALAGDTTAAVVAIAVVVAIVNAIIACILACARFFYSTGRDSCWGSPVDQWMCAVHGRFNSPWLATVLVGAFGAVCCLVPLQSLVVITGSGLVAIYAGITIGVIRGRSGRLTAHAPYQMPFYPIAPIVTLTALVGVVWATWLDVEEGRPGLIVTGVQILLSLIYYQLVLRRRGDWTAQIPDQAGANSPAESITHN